MTTTPNPTAEQLREMVANLIPLDLIHDRQRPGQPQDAFEAADRIIAALRAHGPLSEGAPSKEHEDFVIQEAKRYIKQHGETVATQIIEKLIVLAAGVAAQGPRPNETKSGQDFVSLDREKLVAVRLYCENQGDKFRYHAGRILEMLEGDAPGPSQELVLDPEKVAEVVESASMEWQFKFDQYRSETGDDPGPKADYIAHALCEAAKRGELTC